MLLLLLLLLLDALEEAEEGVVARPAPFARLYASKLNDGSSASQNAPSTFES